MSEHTWREFERADMDAAAAHAVETENRAGQDSGRTSELLPCPFCGEQARCYQSDAFNDGGYFEFIVQCKGVDDHTLVNNYLTEAEAIAAWNMRAERTCELKGKSDICSECGAFVERVTHSVYEMGDGFACHPNYCPNCGCKVVGE